MQKAAALIKMTSALFEKRFLKETGRNTDRRYRRYEAGAPAVGAKDTEPCLWQEMQKVRNRGSGRRCKRYRAVPLAGDAEDTKPGLRQEVPEAPGIHYDRCPGHQCLQTNPASGAGEARRKHKAVLLSSRIFSSVNDSSLTGRIRPGTRSDEQIG